MNNVSVYTILNANGTKNGIQFNWPPPEHTVNELLGLMRPLLETGPIKEVKVMHDGKPKQMIINELGHAQAASRLVLPLNETATKIYRDSWLAQHPKVSRAALPLIGGVAVLFWWALEI